MRLALCILSIAFGAQVATAADSLSGSSALALAGLVGIQSPLVSVSDRKILLSILNGDLSFSYPANGQILVKADSVTCRLSDVDISAHGCTLKFGGATRTSKGREAHELYATLVENGIPSDGAAGSIFESVSHLSCSVKPTEVKQRGGGGVTCTTDAAPGS